ncbi:FHA domain-containing protein [Candidatus Sumerlaeota bacterium]|nr:FHA domain-containing protein [Candidatus Sumerlaeota bacterium]
MNHVRLTVQGRANWVHTHAMGEKGRITVGRGPDNDVDLSDPHSSSQHAMIARKGGGYIIRDLGSRNGTFINGRKIESDTLLNHGDQIRVGLTEMQFLTDAEHSFSSVSPIPPPPESEASAPPDEIQEFPTDLQKTILNGNCLPPAIASAYWKLSTNLTDHWPAKPTP